MSGIGADGKYLNHTQNKEKKVEIVEQKLFLDLSTDSISSPISAFF